MVGVSAEQVREIESVVTDWLHDNDVPGASVIIVDEDDERYAEGFGARDIETNAPATPDTLYGMGSITKSLTALAIVQLVEERLLSVDDAVNTYVDHYADAPGEPITIEELLSHTSGMPAIDPGLLTQTFEGVPAGVADEADRKRLIRDSTEFRVTGEDRFLYYNTGYDILGAVVEAVDGRPYAEYVREEILDPLGMDRSTFNREPFETDEDTMTGYRPGDDDESPEPTPFPFEEFIHPAGGLVSSVRELSRYLRAMITDGTFDGARVCPEGALERLQQGRAVRQTFLDGSDEEYGYGWMRQPLVDDVVVGHGGSVLVSTAYAGYLADAGLGVVVACNTTADPHPGNLGQAILAIASGQDVTAVPAFALEEKCETVTGTYTSFRDEVTATVERDGGGLSLTLSGALGEEEFTAFPVTLDSDDHEFYTISGAGARNPVEFDLGGDGDDLFFRRSRLRRTGPAE